ncbi:single-stranded DNA-binding protein [Aliivibrio fischeri]
MAAKGVNKVILLGHLGQDPEIRYNNSGKIIASFTLATGEYWRDKETREQRESTEWHKVVVFGKLGEIIKDKAKKGTQIYLEGKNKTTKWKDENGKDHSTTEVVVEGFNGVIQIMK